MEIKQEETKTKGRLVALDGATEMGEMTYSIANEQLLIVDHTGVDEAYKGQKVGLALFYKLVELTRTDGRKIMALCPFARKMFERHSDTHDVLRDGSL